MAIAKKIPSDVVETDEKLLRYFDRAQLHLEGGLAFVCLKEYNMRQQNSTILLT